MIRNLLDVYYVLPAITLVLMAVTFWMQRRHRKFVLGLVNDLTRRIQLVDARSDIIMMVAAETIHGYITDAQDAGIMSQADAATLAAIGDRVYKIAKSHDTQGVPAMEWIDTYHDELTSAATAAADLLEPLYLDTDNPALGPAVQLLRKHVSVLRKHREFALERRQDVEQTTQLTVDSYVNMFKRKRLRSKPVGKKDESG